MTTPSFEMFTTNAPGPASQELEFLERIQSFFVNSSPLGNNGEALPVQIIAFRSEAEYAPYAFRAVGGAFYLRTFNRDYIILRDLAPGDRELVAHEFTHLVVEHAGLKLPLWLNEGLAEVYSSVEPAGERVTVGRPLSQHLQTMHRQPWIPWDVLFAVDHNSPYYNEGKKVSMFYAQSWALVHMLALSEDYSAHFRQFLLAVSAGQSSNEALQSIYHKTVAAVDTDLLAYLHRKSLPTSVFDSKVEISRIRPQLGLPSDFQLSFALASLLSAKPSTFAEAEAKLSALSTRYPERPEPEETLGTLALQQNQKEEARSHFALAVQRHSRNAEVFYQYAALQEGAGLSGEMVAVLLRQAIVLDPSFDKARLELGFVEEQEAHFESALSLFSSLKVVPPDAEYEVYSAVAQCNLRLERAAEAKIYAEKAKQAARNKEQKQEADDLLATLRNDENTETVPSGDGSNAAPAKPAPGLTSVWGKPKILECSAGVRRLRVDVDGRDMVFDINDPNLVVRNAGEGYALWRCGPLKSAALTVVYTPQTSAANGDTIDGKVRELVFVIAAGATSTPKR